MNEDDNITLFVKIFGKFRQNDKTLNFGKRRKLFNKKNAYTSTQNFTCFEYRNQGHIKVNCSKLSMKNGHQGRKKSKSKKSYIAWDENEVSSSPESKSEEYANLTSMTSHHSDDEYEKFSNDFSLYDNDAQGAIDELLNECKVLYKMMSTQKKQKFYLSKKRLRLC